MVQLKSERTPFSFNLPFKPTALVLDPGLYIPRDIRDDESAWTLGAYRSLLRHEKTILVVPAAMKDEAKTFADDFMDLTVKTDSEVTPDDMKANNLAVVGYEVGTEVLPGLCPYKVTQQGMQVGSATYRDGAFAAAVMDNPQAPGKYVLFMTSLRSKRMDVGWARTIVLDKNDKVLGGEVAELTTGASVWRPKQ